MIGVWLLAPLLGIAVFTGLGLALDALLKHLGRASASARREIPLPLIPALGLVLVILIGAACSALGSGGAAAFTPLCVALALVGIALSLSRLRPSQKWLWPAAAALVVFVAHGAAVIFTGEPTLAGYIKLDDTATWLALSDQLSSSGLDLSSLTPSTYEAVVRINLEAGYPIGAFLPLVSLSQLSGSDPAWLIQPLISLLPAMLALIFYWIVGSLGGLSQRVSALISATAALSALLIGYGLWGGLKELLLATLLAALISAITLIPRSGAPAAALTGLTAAAVFASLGPAAGVWLLPLALSGGALLMFRSAHRPAWRLTARSLAISVAAFLICSVPTALQTLNFNTGFLTDETELGNLNGPLSPLQLLGIWPSTDFRVEPPLHPLIVIIVIAAAVLAAWTLLRALKGAAAARSPAPASESEWPLIMIGAILVTVLAVVLLGSPWAGGKVLATASPFALLLALIGAVNLSELSESTARRSSRGARIPRAVSKLPWREISAALTALLVICVGWSAVQAYRGAWIAPYDQMSELELIGEKFSGQGPALMTEYQPYGVRHFLRSLDAEGASELRRSLVPLTDGSQLEKGQWADTDQIDPAALGAYKTLVLRRSPAQSRPPSAYRLVWGGEYYTVWQLRSGASPATSRLALGTAVSPVAEARCRDVRELARSADQLAAVSRIIPGSFSASQLTIPDDWRGDPPGDPYVWPRSDGELSTRFSVVTPAEYGFWLGGSLRGGYELRVDGKLVGSGRGQINNSGQYNDLGSVELGAGVHELTLKLTRPALQPGSGGPVDPAGPLIIAPDDIDTDPFTVPASDYRELCGKTLDWIEAVR